MKKWKMQILKWDSQLFPQALKGLYPNPASDKDQLNLEVVKATATLLEITDVTGKTVLRQQLNLGVGNHVITVDIAELPKKIFLLNLIFDNTVKSERLVKY